MNIKIVGILITILFVISAFANAANVKTYSIEEKTGCTSESSEWVIMFYFDGDNKLSNYMDDELEKIRLIGSTDDIKIAVLVDGKPLNDTKLYYLNGQIAEEQEWPMESDMSDPETLIQFSDKVMTDYPAEHYALTILSNKGSGWQGVCWDEHGDDIMITMPELSDALDTITENGCFKLGVLLIQSCICGNLELRYQVRQFCDYFVGYADCGLVGDIPFNDILTDLIENPSMTPKNFATCIINNFVPQDIGLIEQAMGATDSSKLDELAATIDELALLFIEKTDLYKEDIQTALASTRVYGDQFSIDYYIDLVNFLELCTIEDSDFVEVKNNVLNKIENAVIAKVTLEDYPSCGFNFYFPDVKDEYNDALRYSHALPSPYEATLFAMDTKWDEFLKTYLDLLDNTAPNIPSITGPNKGKTGEEQEFILLAIDPQDDDVSFYIEWGDNTYEMAGSISSGEEITVNHIWETEGTYEIKVKSKDRYGAESDWATFAVSMPRNKATNNPLFLQFLQNFLQQYPILYQLLLRFLRL